MGIGSRPENPMGVIGCMEEADSSLGTCGVAQAEIYFRPLATYEGEFGFDWMRVGDWDHWSHSPLFADDTHTDDKYSEIIAGGKGFLFFDKGKDKAYRNLEDEYGVLPIKGKGTHYHRHWLALFPEPFAQSFNSEYSHPAGAELKSEATLEIIIKIHDLTNKPDRIIFVNKNPNNIEIFPLSLSCDTISSSSKKILGQITIKCKTELSYDGVIEAYSVKGNGKNEHKSLAGVLVVSKNDAQTCQKQDTLIALIKTALDGVKQGNGHNAMTFDHKKFLLYFLHQNLVYGKIIEQSLDLRKDPYFRDPATLTEEETKSFDRVWSMGKYVSDGYIKGGMIKSYKMTKSYLPSKISTEYKDYVQIFVFDEQQKGQLGLQGYSYLKSKRVIIFNTGSSLNTCWLFGHEVGHSLGLDHTFIDNGSPKYYFNRIEQTDNFMAYNFGSRENCTWRWQWKIVNKNLE